MPEPAYASALDAEIAALTANDTGPRASRFAAAVRLNVRHWEQLRREAPRLADWLILDAYLARCDVEHEPDSLLYAERVSWVRDKCLAYWLRDGWEFVRLEPRAITLMRRCHPGLVPNGPWA